MAGDATDGSDASIQVDGRIDRIRVRTASLLGFGERIIEIPESAFSVLHGTVILDLTADEVDMFPSASIEEDSRRDRD